MNLVILLNFSNVDKTECKSIYARLRIFESGDFINMKYIRDKNNNIIYYFYNESLKDIIVNFNTHKNNIIFIVGNINNIKVDFFGSNSVVFLGDNCSLFHIEIASESVCYIGDNTTSGGANLVAIENQNIIIGNDCLFSWEILLTTSNYHGIYDIHNKNRVSLGEGYIGDHVWCGRRVSILKKFEFILVR